MEGGPPGFGPGFTCPALLRGPHRVPTRVRLRGPNPVPPAFPCRSAPLVGNPPGAPAPGREALQPRRRKGWRPRPLAGLASSPFARRYSGSLDVDFLSSGYLDVSVPPVVLPLPMRSGGGCADFSARVRPFGDPGVAGCVPLARDYRSLPRPSSAPCAKASAVRPGYLPAHPGGTPYPCVRKQMSGCRTPSPGRTRAAVVVATYLYKVIADWKYGISLL